jgi:hypothetical protein
MNGIQKVTMGSREMYCSDRPLPHPITVSGTTAPSAERRQLTVMFCNLVGSTALSAQRRWHRSDTVSITPASREGLLLAGSGGYNLPSARDKTL